MTTSAARRKRATGARMRNTQEFRRFSFRRRPRKRHRALAQGSLGASWAPYFPRNRPEPAKTREKRVVTAPVGIKRLGLVVIALLLAGFGVVLILPFLMPAETVREAVKAEIRAVTGLDPVLRGGASVSLFPTGRVRFDDVSLGDNRTGATALTAKHVVARLRFFPFLIGR